MAQVKVTITDEAGNVIGAHDYRLAEALTTLGQMEAALEALRPTLITDLTRDLLEEEQQRFQKKQPS